MKRLGAIALLIGLLFSISGCREYQSNASYFDGQVLVEYHQTKSRGSDDSVTLSFYGAGFYQVAFSSTPGKNDKNAQYMPKDFNTTVLLSPRVHVINQYILPDFLRITIKRNGMTTEVHDFK